MFKLNWQNYRRSIVKVKPYIISGIPTVSIDHINELAGFHLVDVRRLEEFDGELGHIKGAILKTLGPDLDQYLDEIKKDQDILFICRSGARSATATNLALSKGFKNVFNLEGGMLAWNDKELERS